MVKLNKYMYIRHKNFMDVCCELIKVYDYGSGVSFKIRWWNMGFGNPYNIGYTKSFRLKKADLSNWLYSYTPDRNGDWRQI